MQLSQWLDRTGKSQAWLAQEAGVTPGRVCQVVCGDKPSLNLARQIERATAGEVSWRELRPDLAAILEAAE
jgi:DNA-binding transcriptional regulator YdaS (Cro superfamily)